MKHLKKYKLFESVDSDFEDIKDIMNDIISQKSLNKLIDIKEKYILNYLLGRDKFIFNFIEELLPNDTTST